MSLQFNGKKLRLGDTSVILMSKDRNKVGIGTCTRDKQGHFLLAIMKRFSAALDVDLVNDEIKWIFE